MLSGKLEWNRKCTYTFAGKEYCRVPYVFDGKKILYSPTDTLERLGFYLVVRKKSNGIFEAALLSIAYNSRVVDEHGKEVRKNIENYHFLSGKESTLWVSDTDFRNKLRANRKGKIGVNSKAQPSFRNQECQTYTFTERWVECYVETDSYTTCWINSYTGYYTICQNQEEEDWDGDDWGGGDTDGGSGEGEIIYNEEIKSVDCSSFQYLKTSLADWQEAGLNKIRLKWVWVNNGSSPIEREIYVNHIVFGLPTKYGNGKTLSPAEAANESAMILDAVKILTYQEFRNSPYLPVENVVIDYFKTQLHLAMTIKGGTAGVTGSGSNSIIFKDEERSFFNPRNCK